ncbi:MAG TPA: peptide chain release factor-like protein [Candidatus Hydrogenedentes bacterium]|nr:peptide chain release factor-like protein [Candidatus Hydrogenedentota bacterium]HRK35575.1 peptide chain release factor-like protein [Candidatus Hydrogenedentota bacterium]
MPIAREEDIEITFYRSSGPGGQHKNTTESAVRIRHIPTGLIVVATAERSQLRNKQAALEELERRLAARRRKPKPRVPTKPSKAAKTRRIESKVKRGATKSLRRPPSDD